MSVKAPGTRLGAYELISPAGAGGMGEVWKARDTRVDRLVAIKISQQQFSERFEREARAIAALNHPNICSLYDVGPDYLVMEYVEGSPIHPVQNVRKLLDLAVQIADGLASAHDRGITHRDLKPENILVTNEGRVKILDFGLAKLDVVPHNANATEAATITQPGMVVGTIAYMSPEQARGLPLDCRSDQFAFGAILYELASGKRPFSSDSAPQTMAAIIEKDPEPLPQSVPAPIRWIVERCLAKEPSARYDSTRDLFRELQSLRDHIAEALGSSGSVPAAGPQHEHRRWLWPIAALASVVLAAAAAYWLGSRTRYPMVSQTPVPLTSSGGMVVNPSFSPDGSEVVFAWDGPRGGNHNLYVKLLGSNDLLRVTNGGADEFSPAWAPDGKRIAFVRNLNPARRAVMLISALGGGERKLTEIGMDDYGQENHAVLTWTPDGRYLAVAEGNRLDLVSVETAERQPLLHGTPGLIEADPAFSPSGDRLAFVRRLGPFSSRLLWVSLGAGYKPIGTPHELRTPGMVAYSPLWDQRGQLLVAGGAPFGMRLYRVPLNGGPPVQVLGAMIGGSMALHRDTGRLIYSSPVNIQNLYRIPLNGPGKVSGLPERLTSTSGTDFFPHYSPDGLSVAFSSFRFSQYGVWTIQTGSPVVSQLADWGQGLVADGAWSLDGKSFVVFGIGPRGWYQIYRIAVDTRQVTNLINDAAHDVYPTFSRDGNFIYFSSSKEGGLKLYKMPAAGGPATMVVARGVTHARESADGRWLYFAEWLPGRLYRMPVAGGEIQPVAESLTDPSGYELAGQGIYYWTGNRSAPTLRYLDVPSQKDRVILQPAVTGSPTITISPDGRWLCFPLIERNSQELMMIENWR